jgi:hypothetical protein
MSAQGDISAGLRAKPERPKMAPVPEAVATAEMTHSDLKEVSARLGRVTKLSWASVFASLGVLALGAALGGVYGLISVLDASPHPDAQERVIYFGALGVGLIVGLGSVAGAFFMRKERAETVDGIKTDLDKKLAGWVLPDTNGPVVSGSALPASVASPPV